MQTEVTLPGEQVLPLPKKANKNKKNNSKNKPNGFICFANSQKPRLASQYNIRGPQALVELCDPLWRALTPDEKKMWNQRAKEEHARNVGLKKKATEEGLRMDCNGQLIVERQEAVMATNQRRQRERKLVREELERCEEVMDKEFFLVDALSTVQYMDGEQVPCEVAIVKCSIRGGILGHYHFYPDPGPLRPGHFAEALERCEKEHEIPPKDFSLASIDYEGDVTKMNTLMRANGPKMPFLFARSSEAKKVESCLEWLGYRVNQEFKPRVMELESFVLDLVAFTNNSRGDTFSQFRRLLFETKFDFVQGNRCEYHSQTDKISCAIGNVRKYFYFIAEYLYDYYDFQMVEGHHTPLGFEKGVSRAPSVASYSVGGSLVGDFSDTMSLRSSISVGSYMRPGHQALTPYAPLKTATTCETTPGIRTPHASNNSFLSCAGSVGRGSRKTSPRAESPTGSEPGLRRPHNSSASYKLPDKPVNSFAAVAKRSPHNSNTLSNCSANSTYVQPSGNMSPHTLPPPQPSVMSPTPSVMSPPPSSSTMPSGSSSTRHAIGRGRGVAKSHTTSNLRRPNVEYGSKGKGSNGK